MSDKTVTVNLTLDEAEAIGKLIKVPEVAGDAKAHWGLYKIRRARRETLHPPVFEREDEDDEACAVGWFGGEVVQA